METRGDTKRHKKTYAILKKEVGANLKRIRVEGGLGSQADVASRFKLELSTYQKWEQGLSCRTIEDILMISGIWNMDPVVLFAELIGDCELATIIRSIDVFSN